ncbi:ATP-binding cassette domain-containing protein [Candidatus Poribacteria bacterium]|nr:ATP-binding cassette domain-containing protein [Candidatus Poribacteria bacterium]
MQNYIIRVEEAVQKYRDRDGQMRTVLNNINLRVRRGEFLTVVGPTGCGKSTLLRLILGSEVPFSGKVMVNDVEVKEPSRDRGIVFQKYSLYENRTVRENVMLGLELEQFTIFEPYFRPIKCRRKRKEFREKADIYLERVGLLRHADKHPHQLSGGMRQRAAIAQAMVMQPEVLLMDEPFGALDIGTREAMQVFVLEQWQKDHQTIIFVTHDLEEAIFIGSRIVVLSQYYSDDDGGSTTTHGSMIVKDVQVPWPLPRPTDVKHTKEFNELMMSIRREGLDPDYLQNIKDFDLSHEDAAWWNGGMGWAN